MNIKAQVLVIDDDAVVPYTWDFPSVDAMVRYVSLLFGLDRATPEQVLEQAAHLGGVARQRGRVLGEQRLPHRSARQPPQRRQGHRRHTPVR